MALKVREKDLKKDASVRREQKTKKDDRQVVSKFNKNQSEKEKAWTGTGKQKG